MVVISNTRFPSSETEKMWKNVFFSFAFSVCFFFPTESALTQKGRGHNLCEETCSCLKLRRFVPKYVYNEDTFFVQVGCFYVYTKGVEVRIAIWPSLVGNLRRFVAICQGLRVDVVIAVVVANVVIVAVLSDVRIRGVIP